MYGTTDIEGPPKHSLDNPDELVRWLERFRSIDENGCWNWTRAVNGGGYGVMVVDDRQLGVHQIAAVLFVDHGLASGVFVLHHCDNPRCFNPNHLFLGSHNDNMQDKIRKGRSGVLSGESAPWSKLSYLKAERIRLMIDIGESQSFVARVFGVSQTNISSIVRGKTWRNSFTNAR